MTCQFGFHVFFFFFFLVYKEIGMLFCNFFNISIFSYEDFLSIVKYYKVSFHPYIYIYIYIYIYKQCFIFKKFLAVLCSLWGLSSLTREGTRAPGYERVVF